MKRWLLSLLVVPFVFAVPASADYTVGYGWEDGVNTILGSFGNLCCDVNQNVTVHSGTQALQFQESPLGGTPQGYVARVANLTDGDVVTASFWAYDTTPGASPSSRIWGHYEDACGTFAYAGSASGNTTYSDGTGWSQLSYTWVFDSDGGTRSVLCVEARIYSVAEFDTAWIDDVEVTAPDGADIFFPGGDCSPTATEENSWGNVKGLFR